MSCYVGVFLGTFALVWTGTGAIIANDVSGGIIGHAGVALTFLFMFVIIHVAVGAKERGLMAGVAVGGIVGLEAMFVGPITGASMNPARSLAPALASGNLNQVWIYLTAPFLGASLAILSCRLMRDEGCCLVVGDAECTSEA